MDEYTRVTENSNTIRLASKAGEGSVALLDDAVEACLPASGC